MKKFKKPLIAVLSTTVAVAGLFSLGACSSCNKNKPLTDEPLNVTKIADYTKTAEDRKETFASGSKGYSWENGEPFNVWWKPQNVSYEGGKLSLSISEMTEKEQAWDEEKQQNVDCNADYYGAEERSEHYYGYGDFQVRMKPSKTVGTASTFFTCTGPYDVWYDEDGEPVKQNKHDEIDIEFLGKDTTKVQFNYFANGVGGHEYMYDLGFDASVEFHDYGYRWTDSYITWFVDSKPVYRIDRQGDEAWPETAGRIIMNYWCATEKASEWMGEFEDDYTGKAEYEYIATGSKQCPDPNTAHIKEEPPVESDIPTEGWTDISIDSFDGWGKYTVGKTDGLTISHSEEMDGYDCCGMDLDHSYSWVKFNIKNTGEVAAEARIDVKNKNIKNGGAVEAVSPANENVKLLTADSAAFIRLDAGEEIEVVLKVKNVYVNQFVVFLNSTVVDKAETGSITITGLKGILNNDVTPPEPTGDSSVKIGTNEVTFSGDYDVVTSADKSSMTIEYTDVKGSSYKNISTDISGFVAANNLFVFTVKNEGSETVKIRMDIGCDVADGSAKTEDGSNADGKNNFCNIGAEYSGTIVESGNDYDWGGADWVKIAAGETVTVTIKFTAGVAKDIKFYLDSSTYDDPTSHSGKVVFSSMNLSTEGEGEDPEQPEQPVFEVPEAGWENIADNFDGWEMYTLERFTDGYYNSVRLISKNTPINYNDCCGMDLSKSYKYVMFTLKNELGDPAEVWFDFKMKDVNDTGTVIAAYPENAVTVNDDGKAVVQLSAYQSLNVILKLDDTKEMNQVVVFLNSSKEEDNPQNGRVIIYDMKGVVNEEFSNAETVEIPEEGWTDISTEGFGDWEMFEVEQTEEGLTIGHSSANNKNNCCGMDLSANYSWIRFKVTNNGTGTAKVRIDFKKNETDKTKPGMVVAAYPANIATVLKNEKAVAFVLGAGKTEEITIKLESEYFDQMIVFLNSVGDVNAATGSITISDFQGIADPSIEHKDPNVVDSKDLSFVASNSIYSITPESQPTSSVTVSYNNISYGSFYYIRSEIESFASEYNTFTFTVTNNGSQEMQMRVGITRAEKYYDGQRENINVCHDKSTITPNSTTYQDDRGGAYVSVGSGQTLTFTLKYDPSQNPKQLIIYLDSCKKDANEQRSGNVTISDFKFSNT